MAHTISPLKWKCWLAKSRTSIWRFASPRSSCKETLHLVRSKSCQKKFRGKINQNKMFGGKQIAWRVPRQAISYFNHLIKFFHNPTCRDYHVSLLTSTTIQLPIDIGTQDESSLHIRQLFSFSQDPSFPIVFQREF